MNGLLNVLKPPGMTSHDVVRVVRKLTGAKVGHTGTLDPLAAGVLVLTVGGATRLTDFVTTADKAYRAELILGLETDTHDLEGTVTRRASAAAVTREQVLHELGALTGVIEMAPPMYSAVKHEGRRLYELARAGAEVARAPRPVTVTRFELEQFASGDEARCLCTIECSKGTYVRSLAQLLGERLGCGACLGFLLRTAHGRYSVTEAVTLEELAACDAAGRSRALIPMTAAVPQFPQVAVEEKQAAALREGRAIPHATDVPAGTMVMVTLAEQAVCLADVSCERDGSTLRPRRVF